MRHGMAADGEASATVIGPQALFGVHGGERRRLASFFLRFEQRAHRQGGALRLPESVAAMERGGWEL